MSGYKVSKSPWTANTDLSAIFKARTSTKIADVGYSDINVDLSNTYEPIGLTTKVNDVGYSSGGVDISTLFMDINEVLESIVWAGATHIGVKAATGGTPETGAAQHWFDVDGGTRISLNEVTSSDSVDWCDSHPSTTGSDYEIRTGTITGSGGIFSPSYASDTTYNLGTVRTAEVYVTDDTPVVASRNIPIQVRDSGGGTVTAYNLVLTGEIVEA